MQKHTSTDSIISRRDFLRGTAQMAFFAGAAGCLWGCMNKKDDDPAQQASLPVTLTAEQKASLDTNGFLNLNGIIVIKDGSTYRAFSRTCPHESGTVTAQSATSLQCQRHTDQFYNNLGQGNGARTSASLQQYTVTNNSGTLTIS